MASTQNTDGRPEQRDAERYRRALEDLSQQLDWCIGYLHGIRKTEVATALAKNRTHIKRRILDDDTEPLATEMTSE